MFKELLLSLPANIFTKFNYLKQDYVGMNFNLNIFGNIFFGFGIAFGLILISYFLGKKISNLLFKKEKKLNINYLLYIALGYISFSTSIAILGFFSLF